MSYRFHGQDPSSWDEELGLHHELRFASAPDDDAAQRLGRLYVDELEGPTDPGAWVFSDRYASFVVMPGRADARGCLEAVERFVEKAHEIAPIEEVIFTGAAMDFPALDPGPAFEPTARPIDAALPPPTAHAAFDRGVADARAARGKAKAKKRKAATKRALADQTSDVTLEPLEDAVTVAAQNAYPEAVRARFEGAVGYFTGPHARPVRIALDGLEGEYLEPRAAIVVRGKSLALPEGMAFRPAQLALSPDATRALISVTPIQRVDDGGQLWLASNATEVMEVDLDDGAEELALAKVGPRPDAGPLFEVRIG